MTTEPCAPHSQVGQKKLRVAKIENYYMHKNLKDERVIHFVAFILRKTARLWKTDFEFYNISVLGLLANMDSESLFPEGIHQSLKWYLRKWDMMISLLRLHLNKSYINDEPVNIAK